MRQTLLAIFAMLLVVAVGAFEDLRSKDTVPKVRIAGTVTQLTSLERSGHNESLRFRLSSLPFELDIAAALLVPLTRQGVRQPFEVGSHVEVILAKSEVATHEGSHDSAGVPVLALLVEGQPVLGNPEALRLAPTMRTWPYLLLLGAAGAAWSFLGHKRQRRRSRRT